MYANILQARFGQKTEVHSLMRAISHLIENQMVTFTILDDGGGSGCWIISIEEEDFLELPKATQKFLRKQIEFMTTKTCGTVLV